MLLLHIAPVSLRKKFSIIDKEHKCRWLYSSLQEKIQLEYKVIKYILIYGYKEYNQRSSGAIMQH